MLKGVLVVIDGMGDLPHKLLGNQTPLDVAEIPNMDFFAARGEMGYMYTVRPNFVPESDEAIVSMFGNELISSTRGQLEARGTDISLTRGDLALRANFATIKNCEKGEILDRRVGRTLTTEEAEELADAIMEKVDLPVKFEFQPTVQHRAALVFKGGFSDNISGNDATYIEGKSREMKKASLVKPLDEDDENARYTSNVVNEFLKQACEILDSHPINLERKKKGLMPANYLLIRGPGIEPPKLKQYKNWVGISYMPLEIGFVKASGMKLYSFGYPRLKKLDAYDNLYAGLRRACKYAIKGLKKNRKTSEYIYIHLKETDVPGHDNKPLEKKQMLELIDKILFKYLRKVAPKNQFKVVVTADHSTPCRMKDHSSDPVPVLFYDPKKEIIPKEKHFSESEARKGSLKRMLGKDLLKKVGFVK